MYSLNFLSEDDECDSLFEIAYKKGYAIGYEEGYRIGYEEGYKIGVKIEATVQKYNFISQVMKSLSTDFTSAANILAIPESERDMFESLILGKESIEDVIKKIG